MTKQSNASFKSDDYAVVIGGLDVSENQYRPLSATVNSSGTASVLQTIPSDSSYTTASVSVVDYANNRSDGLTSFRVTSLGSAPNTIKTSGGAIYRLNAINAGTAVSYIKFFNAVGSNVTIGTTVPLQTIAVAANGGQVYRCDLSSPVLKTFDTGISVAAVTSQLDTGTVSSTANTIVLEVDYV